MKRAVAWTFVLTLLAASLGCNAARYVRRQPDGGVIAIPARTDTWPDYHLTRAHELMQKHLPDGYTVFDEEEKVTGKVTTNHEETDTNHVGPFVLNEHTRNRVETRDTTEYWLHYRAK